MKSGKINRTASDPISKQDDCYSVIHSEQLVHETDCTASTTHA